MSARYVTVLVHYYTVGNPPGHQFVPANEGEVKTKLEPLLKCILAAEQLGLAGNSLPKLSILCLYLRIFPGRKSRLATWIMIVVVSILWLAWFILGINQCSPVAYQWDRTILGGHCFDNNKFYRSFAGPNVRFSSCLSFKSDFSSYTHTHDSAFTRFVRRIPAMS